MKGRDKMLRKQEAGSRKLEDKLEYLSSRGTKQFHFFISIISILLLGIFITTTYAQAVYYIVSGNSMYPTLKDGDIVKVEKQESYNDGDTVVAEVGGKKVIKRINGDVLEGDNKGNTARYNLKTADILGKAEYRTNKLTEDEKKAFERVFASGVEMVSGGTDYTIALKSDGTVWGWGNNTYGELGDNTTIQRLTPVQVHGVGDVGYLTGVSQVSAGSYFSGGHFVMALMNDGTVYAWGYNALGRLGDNTTTDRHTPVQVHGVENVGYLTGISQVSAGDSSTVALKSDGTVYAWGNNTDGQLGKNTSGAGSYIKTPIQVHGVGDIGYLTGVSQVVAGYACSVALKTDGTVYAWGWNPHGEIGDNTTTSRLTPVQVHGVGNVGYLTGVSQVAVGTNHTLALKTDGTVYTWGWNLYGEIGDNTTTNKLTPVQVHGEGNVGYLTGVSQVSAGQYSTVALKTDGTVYAWGWNNFGQLGDNTTTDRLTPVQVHGVGNVGYLTGVSQVSAGKAHVVILKTGGAVYAWGHNGVGELGDNTTTEGHTSVQVHGVGNLGYFLCIIDNTPPTLTINASPVSPTNATTITYTFQFSEDVTGFDASDISITNGTRNDGTFTGSGATYTITVTKVADGDQVLTVVANACQDAATNLNTEGTITVLMTSLITDQGYSLGTVAGDRKWFKYYIGKDGNNITKVMLVAPKDGDGVKQGTFSRDDILDQGDNKFISGSIYYIDREGKIQLYN
ncbi:MAG TPA: hypothetical protein DCP90_02515 [Clostridiales bacterium]|nr:hypothetical protein [Clostridiales bacterium]